MGNFAHAGPGSEAHAGGGPGGPARPPEPSVATTGADREEDRRDEPLPAHEQADQARAGRPDGADPGRTGAGRPPGAGAAGGGLTAEARRRPGAEAERRSGPWRADRTWWRRRRLPGQGTRRWVPRGHGLRRAPQPRQSPSVPVCVTAMQRGARPSRRCLASGAGHGKFAESRRWPPGRGSPASTAGALYRAFGLAARDGPGH